MQQLGWQRRLEGDAVGCQARRQRQQDLVDTPGGSAPLRLFDVDVHMRPSATHTAHGVPVRKLAGSSRWWSAAINAPVPPCQRIDAGALGYPCTGKGA